MSSREFPDTWYRRSVPIRCQAGQSKESLMGIIVFILLAGLWAAFLLPSFFDHRRKTPRATTRDFARSNQKLATVAAAQPGDDQYIRRHVQARRQRVFIGLFFGAVLTLAIAVWQNSVVWLGVTVVFDLVIASYVMLLVHVKQQGSVASASVVTLPSARAVTVAPVAPDSEHAASTVRVIAG